MRLTAGSHVFKTGIKLPQNLPENYRYKKKDSCSNETVFKVLIDYVAEVHVKLPLAPEVIQRESFCITPHYDLNEFPNLRNPISTEDVRMLGWCRSKPVKMNVLLPRRAFNPGDRVKCTIVLDNESSVAILVAHVKLVQYITFPGSAKHIKLTLWSQRFTRKNRQLVPATQNKKFVIDLHFDPLWDYHYFDGCSKIINVAYYLKCTAITPMWHNNLKTVTRIHIGTVPLLAN